MSSTAKETRNTKQKALIRECLIKSGKHMTVDEIYASINKDSEKISIATIYRNLKLLEEQGIIKKLYMCDDVPPLYEMNEQDEHTHHHLVCKQCGAVIDFDEDLLESVEKTIEEKNGFKVEDHRVVFYGICSKCQKKN